MTVEELAAGKNYFCNYFVSVDPEEVPALAGQNIPMARMNGKAQIMQRDVESKMCIIVDLMSHQQYVVPFENISEIQEVA
jgi:hypothetical protein